MEEEKPQTEQPSQAEEAFIDAKLLSDALIELNITRRNVQVFPKDHPTVQYSLQRAFEYLQRLFEIRPVITLAITESNFIIDDRYVDPKNPVFREYATYLHNLGISAVTFKTGLDLDELYTFHHLTTQKYEDFDECKKAFAEAKLIHISVKFVEYDYFVFKEQARTREHLWERYIYGLMTGSLKRPEEADLSEIPPEQLATILNKLAEEKQEEGVSYEEVITSYLRKSSEGYFSADDLKRLLEVVNSLRPEVKKAFLASTTAITSQDIDTFKKAVEELPVDMIIQMLETLNETGITLPEEVRSILQSLASLSEEDALVLSTMGSKTVVDDFVLSQEFGLIFKEGHFTAYIPEDYRRDLEKIKTADLSKVHIEKPPEMDDLTDTFIERKFSEVALDLIFDESITEEEFQTYTERLKESMLELVVTGQYDLIVQIMNAYRDLLQQRKFTKICQKTLEYFYSEEFINLICESISMFGRYSRDESKQIVDFYGMIVLVPLIERLMVEESTANRRFLLSLIERYGKLAAEEAIKRLPDPRWFVKRNMLYIIRTCGTPDAMLYVSSYLHHENLKVRAEAIRAALQWSPKEAIEVLKEMLQSPSDEEFEMALNFVASQKLKELVPTLLEVLQMKDLLGDVLSRKMLTIKALCSMKAEEALPAFREIMAQKSFFYRKYYDQMRIEILKAIEEFPFEKIKDIVQMALQSKNDEIRILAKRIESKVKLQSQK